MTSSLGLTVFYSTKSIFPSKLINAYILQSLTQFFCIWSNFTSCILANVNIHTILNSCFKFELSFLS